MNLSLDVNRLVRAVKKAAVEAVNAADPVAMKLGEVVAINPLKIKLNQKITLSASQLLLTDAVRDFLVDISSGDYRKNYTVHLGLNVGENVILLRCDGGQKFIVLDRLEVPK